jgi:hypothetical protein
MRILTVTAAAAVLVAASTTAFAAEARLSDSQFIKAAKCRAVATGDQATRLDTLIKSQKRGRSVHIVDEAFNARTDAERLARRDASAAQALAGDCEKIGA